MHYYQHNIGDYRRDTAHLSLLEHGIYRQLLDTYYLNEEPLSLDDASVMRSHCIRSADEMQAYKNVLNDFFIRTEKGYIHTRCDSEIGKFKGKSAKSKKAASARWEKEKMQTHSERNAQSMRTHCEGNANHKPITNNQDKKILPPLPPKGGDLPDGKPVGKPKAKPKPKAFDPASVDLPECVRPAQWERWCKHRKELKKPLTASTVQSQIKKLENFFNLGYDANEVIEDSISNGWQGLFEPKGKGGSNASAARYTAEAEQSIKQHFEQFPHGMPKPETPKIDWSKPRIVDPRVAQENFEKMKREGLFD